MRITHQPPIGQTPAAKTGVPAQSSQRAQFRLPDDDRPASMPTSRTQQAMQAAGLETLIAVQSAPDGEERRQRRRKMFQRGKTALDLLDRLKVDMLSGAVTPTAMLRLKGASAEPRLPTGEAGLDEVLDAIDLRTQVELAKFEARWQK